MSTRSRVSLVTGAARGIGAATVRELCRQGYGVVAVDSCAGNNRPAGVDYDLATSEDLDTLATDYPDQVQALQADVRDIAQMHQAVALATDRFGRLDAVVAAAGVIAGGEPQWQTGMDQVQTLIENNVYGVWNTASAAVPALLASDNPGECAFVAVASAAGHEGMFRLAAYNASKHAVVGLVRGLAADLVGTGVAAIAVSPGSTRTEMLSATAALYELPSREEFAQQQLLHRLITPEEMAAVIGFCCSPGANALNGSVVQADGGFGK